MWRIVTDGMATLTEIEQHWSYADLVDANEMLDIRAELEWREHQRLKAKEPKPRKR